MIDIRVFRIRVFVILWVLVLPFIFVGCSDDDDGRYDELVSTRYCSMGSDNTNMPSSGTLVVEYGDAPDGYDISMMVDGDVSTWYITYHDEFDVTWHGSKSVTVLSYALTSAGDQSDCDPKDWVLYGSSDTENWFELDTQSEQIFDSRGLTKTYSVDNTSPFLSYKLSITDNQGGSATQIAEFVLSVDAYEEESTQEEE